MTVADDLAGLAASIRWATMDDEDIILARAVEALRAAERAREWLAGAAAEARDEEQRAEASESDRRACRLGRAVCEVALYVLNERPSAAERSENG